MKIQNTIPNGMELFKNKKTSVAKKPAAMLEAVAKGIRGNDVQARKAKQ